MNPKSRAVIDLVTGVVYPSVSKASRFYNVSSTVLDYYLKRVLLDVNPYSGSRYYPVMFKDEYDQDPSRAEIVLRKLPKVLS